jgi:hypothetical protein
LLTLENAPGRGLALHYRNVAQARPARVATATFITPEAAKMGGYGLIASPALYPGQTVRAAVIAEQGAITCGLFVRAYGADDQPVLARGPQVMLDGGQQHEFSWRIPDLTGSPVYEIGLEFTSEHRTSGLVLLDYLTWDGTPEVTFTRPPYKGNFWRQAWVNGVDHFESWAESFRLIQDSGTGLLLTGTREWMDYKVSTVLTPHMVKSCGLAARVQGMRRYYALVLGMDGRARLIKALDGMTTLAEAACPLEFDASYTLTLTVTGSHLQADLDGKCVLEATDADLPGGGIALICEEGRVTADTVTVKPVS